MSFNRAIEVWGSLEALENARKLRDLEIKNQQECKLNS